MTFRPNHWSPGFWETISILTLFFLSLLCHFAMITYPNSIIHIIFRNSQKACTIIFFLFICCPMTSSLLVSWSSGAVRPESRSFPTGLGWGLNRPLWAVIGWAHQADQSRQAQNHCCRHPQRGGVSFPFLCSYEIYLSVSHFFQQLS